MEILSCSMITEEYVECQVVVIDIQILWDLKCLRALADLTEISGCW